MARYEFGFELRPNCVLAGIASDGLIIKSTAAILRFRSQIDARASQRCIVFVLCCVTLR
jgi:hypothetical protein